MEAPSRAEVIEKLRSLISERISREEVSDWARKWVIADNPPDMEESVWKAINFLYGVDMISLDRPYLHGREDFEEELEKLIRSVSGHQ